MNRPNGQPAGLEVLGRMPVLVPDWPAPPAVRAFSTTRQGGVSGDVWQSLNLSTAVGDDAAAVQANRERVRAATGLAQDPQWLHQVHGTRTVHLPWAGRELPDADSAWTDRPGMACAVLAADCLPVLLCNRAGDRVAAVHAGWRGLAGGVIESTVTALGGAEEDLLAWLGPAISAPAFEVGPEVRQAFLAADPGAAVCFTAGRGDRWHADLYALARQRLARVGVHEVWGGHWCTAGAPEWFYSWRRDAAGGRMASVIWLAPRAEQS